MKKTIITITFFILIALTVIFYATKSDDTFKDVANATDTAFIVKSFLNKMIPHHQEAVDLSLKVMNDLEITEPKIRIFAANVVDTQSFEISKMENIYREYLGGEYAPTISVDASGKSKDQYQHMMGSADGLKGDELAKSYTKDLIKHHESAVKMSKDYIKLIDKVRSYDSTKENGLIVTNSHPAIDDSYELAKQIIDTQTKEIDIMKTWFK